MSQDHRDTLELLKTGVKTLAARVKLLEKDSLYIQEIGKLTTEEALTHVVLIQVKMVLLIVRLLSVKQGKDDSLLLRTRPIVAQGKEPNATRLSCH